MPSLQLTAIIESFVMEQDLTRAAVFTEAGSNLACVMPVSALSFLHCQKRCIIILYLHYHSKVSSLKKKKMSLLLAKAAFI